MGEFFTREDILAAQDLPFKDVPVPEWGGKIVRVLGLNAEDASSFSGKMIQMDEKGKVKSMEMDNFMPELLSRTLANEKNELLFSQKDVKALGKKSAKVEKYLFEIAMEMSGLSDEAEKSAVKNSDGTPADDSPSA